MLSREMRNPEKRAKTVKAMAQNELARIMLGASSARHCTSATETRKLSSITAKKIQNLPASYWNPVMK
jgi:hypothetical protein